jgi:small-conductance mechanosensitive channel
VSTLSYTESMFSKFIGKNFNEEIWGNATETLIKIILVLVLSKVIIKIGEKTLRKVFLMRAKSPLRTNERRDATLLKLLENIITYVVYFISTMMILEYCGIPVKGLLAGAGIFGLAIGFGAQSLVKDIISGFFVIFEDQFSVGDYIKINTFEGEVLEVGLRTTKLKSKKGELHVIPNGSIIQVTNFSVLNSVSIVDFIIPNDEKSQLAEKLIQQQLNGLEIKIEEIVKAPELKGIETYSPEELVLRVVTETKPLKQDEVSRLIRKEMKVRLDELDIQSTSKSGGEG